MTRNAWILFAALSMVSSGLAGCGYSLRGATRPFFENHNIRTLYVTPVKNNSYKAGVEITIYNALRKRVSQGGYVRLVDNPADADAQIEAAVMQADYAPSAITSADQIAPLLTGPSNILIASSYQVSLQVKFNLYDRDKKSLWGQILSRTESFQATTFNGPLGSTSGLINESEFDRSLGNLSSAIVTDAEESINTIF